MKIRDRIGALESELSSLRKVAERFPDAWIGTLPDGEKAPRARFDPDQADGVVLMRDDDDRTLMTLFVDVAGVTAYGAEWTRVPDGNTVEFIRAKWPLAYERMMRRLPR